MKLPKFKRAIALCITLIMIFVLASCAVTPTASKEQTDNATTGEKLFSKPTDITIVIGSHPSWPYNANWKIWKYFSEATGANLKVQSIPTEYNTKIALMMASPDTLPDLIHLTDKRLSDEYVPTGAFVSIDDNLDKMKNYTAFFDSMPEKQRTEIMNQRRAADGKIYFAPAVGNEAQSGLMSWMYRKDIFEKNGLSVPKTIDELYKTAKTLKKLYPNSYPLVFRDGLPKLDVIGPIWKNNFSSKLYYDFKNNSWHYGASEDTMRQIIEYFIKMRQEGLVPPDFITIKSKSWEELVSTDRGFMMMDFIVRLDFFNKANRSRNPDYTWAVMAPPKTDSPVGVDKVTKLNVDFTGYLVCNTGDQKRIDNAFKLLDWMYSDEGSELLSWGKEGETYKVVNGQKEFILNADEDPRIKYGVGTLGLYQHLDPAAAAAASSKEQAEQAQIASTYTEDNVNPVNWLALTSEEAKEIDDIRVAIDSYSDEQLSKFMLQQRPMSEWDLFQKELKNMNVDKLIAVYSEAYKRVVNSK